MICKWGVIVHQVSEPTLESSANIDRRNIVPTLFYTLAYTCNGDGGGRQPKEMKHNAKALVLCFAQQFDVAPATQGTFDGKRFTISEICAELFKQ